jgi:hypothetical protein
LKNDSALVYCTSALWSNDDQQLVAATIVSNAHETFRAIWASLATNSSKTLFLSYPGEYRWRDEQVVLKGARRGYTTVRAPLGNAAIYAAALLHPLAGDPSTLPEFKSKKGDEEAATPSFYVVAIAGEDMAAKFEQRLAIALPWATQPGWAVYLLEAGQEAQLVKPLSAGLSRIEELAEEFDADIADGATDDEEEFELVEDTDASDDAGQAVALAGPEFVTGLRVVIDKEAWREVIADGLKSKAINLN